MRNDAKSDPDRVGQDHDNSQPRLSQDSEPLLVSVGEASKLLHRSRARTYELIRLKEISHIRDGRSILIPRDALYDWIKRKQRQNEW